MHVLVLFVVPQQRQGISEPPATTGDSLRVNLQPRLPPPGTPTPSAAIPETPPQTLVKHRPKTAAASAIALNKAHAKDLTKPVIPPVSPPALAMPLEDMQAYVNAARARRRSAEGLANREEDLSHERQPSEDETRMAIVRRNLNPGTNGVFQILSMTSRRASFSFRGWTTDSSNPKLEIIQVDIGTNSDIEIAIVRQMIELIRRYYKGDFNWESQRLDRIVILSARTEDNNSLEEFLQKEFFGARSRITQVR